jgi:hypothetical protein
MLITTTSAKAAQRPLAGSGIGAHLRDGLIDATLAGVSGPELGAPIAIETAAALALPRVKWAAAAISEGHAPTDARNAGCQFSIPATTSIQPKAVQRKAQQSKAQHYNYMARVNPAFRGGVGPHPAREPEPV